MPSIFKKGKNGTWYIDTKIKVNGEWKHFCKKNYRTLGEAKEDFDNAKKEFIIRNGGMSEDMPIETLFKQYEKYRAYVVDQSTLQSDMSSFNVNILPHFKGDTTDNIFTQERIKEWYENLINDDRFTNNKKSKVITRMKDLLKFAYNHKIISPEQYQDCDVVIYQVKYSKKPKEERIIWTNEEEKAFIKAISENTKDSLMFRTFLATSPRLGEFLGFQPSSFDYKNKRMIIDHQVKNVTGKGAIRTDKLKTHDSYRTVAIPSDLAEEIKEYIEDFNIGENEYLWYYTSKKKPYSRNTIRRVFDKYCKIAGVRRMNLHALRHNQATKLAAVCKTGEDIEVAARRLGHSPSVFLNTYANHANEQKENELLRRMMA